MKLLKSAMNRRKFFGFAGAAAVAPKVDIRDLDTPHIGNYAADFGGPIGEAPHPEQISRAKKSLAELMKKTKRQKEKEIRNRYVHQMPPDIHVLRSVSIGRKISMAQRATYERWEREHKDSLKGFISGVFKSVL